ncbi:hypothetical protein V492_06941 [Pseudogymnoascus sp. VKM F-4246]|nr:hypothetical protein V492_06941 [Pseudogymnoascus sp. VKM F-4246]
MRGLPHDRWSEGQNEDTIVEMIAMMCLLSKRLLRSIIEGDLPLVRRSSQVVRQELANTALYNTQPGIYVLFFVNQDGKSPSAVEWAEAIRLAELYAGPGLDSDRYADRPQRLHGDINGLYNGKRRFLLTPSDIKRTDTDIKMSATRVDQLSQFVRAMKGRLTHELAAAKRDEPMQRAVSEVGYSKRVAARIQEHIAFRSTNYLMSLFRLIFRDRFPTRRYDIEGHAVMRCISHEDAAIGEILLTTLAQAYVTDGGGFCHQPAGENVVSANAIEHLRWRLFKSQVMENESFARRMEKETALVAGETDCHNTISGYVTTANEVEDGRAEMEALAGRARAVVELAHGICREEIEVMEKLQ